MVPVQVCRIQVLFLNDDDFWAFVDKKKNQDKNVSLMIKKDFFLMNNKKYCQFASEFCRR